MRKTDNQNVRFAFTLVELVEIAIIGILIGILLPTLQSVREADQPIECDHNQRQMGLADHNCESAIDALPPGREDQLQDGEPGLGGRHGCSPSWKEECLPQN